MGLPQTKQETMTGYRPSRPRRIIQDHKSTARWLQILLDQVIVVSLLGLHTWDKIGDFAPDYRIVAVIAVLLMAVVYQANGVYNFTASIFDRFVTLARAWAIVIGIIVLLGFVTKTSTAYSREVILTWSITGFIGQCLMFMLVSAVQSRAKSEQIPTLIIGAGDLAKHLTEHLNNNPWLPDQVVGVISSDTRNRDHWDVTGIPLLGRLEEIESIVADNNIRRVYIALPLKHADQINDIYLSLAEDNIDVIWAPDIFGINLLNHSVREVAGVPIITLSESPLIGSAAFVKTLMDYFIASVALVVLSPLLLLVALAIKLTSPGPILFRQQRHGWDGRIITVYKFRSMYEHEEAGGKVTQACKNDERVTPLGRMLRRTSIDELPQLFNVVSGSMSLVGPRPHAIAHNRFYGEKINSYMLRHRVKPGLTGLAQINGFRGETQTVDHMAERVNYDLAYINNWSVWLDIKIMVRTVFVLVGDSVY